MESITIEIAAAPARVWAVLSDFENWPQWTPSVRSVRRLDAGPVGAGNRVRICQPKFPPAVWEVTEFQPDHHFSWHSSAPGIQVVATHVIEPTTTGSRVTLALHYRGWFGKLLAHLTRGITRRYLEMEANGLKRQSETSLV